MMIPAYFKSQILSLLNKFYFFHLIQIKLPNILGIHKINKSISHTTFILIFILNDKQLRNQWEDKEII